MKYKSPVYNVIAVPIEKVRPNNYNPNKVAPPEMRLLYEGGSMKGFHRQGGGLDESVIQELQEKGHQIRRIYDAGRMLLCKIAGYLSDCGRLPPVSGDDGSSGYLRERTGIAAGFCH